METQEKEWQLVRTNNKEWISELHIFILDEDLLDYVKSSAPELEIHYIYGEGVNKKIAWCYINDIDDSFDELDDFFDELDK